MPIYKYQALDNNIKIKDSTEAFDVEDLRIKLKKEGLILLKATAIKTKKPNLFFSISSKVPVKEVVLFIRQFAIMNEVGISILDSFKTISSQVASKAFKKVLIIVHEDLLQGVSLADALMKHPKVFPKYFCQMISIGEYSSNLPFVLRKSAVFFEKEQKIKRKTKNATAYPKFLFAIVLIVFFFLTTQIIPQFEGILSQLGGEMPPITVITLRISRFIQMYLVELLLGIVALVGIIYLFFKTKPGRYLKDYLNLNIPLIKGIHYNQITARFARGLSVLIASGVNVMESIEIMKKLLNNKIAEKRFAYSIEQIKKGKSIGASVEAISFFPEMFTQMVKTGEQTARLDSVLEISADYYDEALEFSINRAVSLLEPMLIILAGLVVGFVIISVFLPLLSITGGV